jgi:hypothetical protein
MAKILPAILLLALLSGCVAIPDVERSYRECLMHDGSPTYTVTAEMRKVECKRR